jgi:hypothetical protein
MKITSLPARSAVALTDIAPVVDAAAGTPATQKATVAQLRAAMMPVLVGDITVPAAQPISALAIPWADGAVFTKSLASGGNVFTFAGAASGMCIIVRLTGNAGGSTVTWPTVKWPGGVVPTQTSTGIDVYTFFHDGTDIHGTCVQAMA